MNNILVVGLSIFSILFIIFILTTMFYEMYITKELPSNDYQAFAEQKGGTVVPNIFNTIEYTNDTNRYIELKLTHKQISDAEIKLMESNGIKLNLRAVGNVFGYEESFPLNRLLTNNTFPIHIDDGRLDDYRACVWFNNYDGREQCINYSKKLNQTSHELDISHNLLYVNKDLQSENEEMEEFIEEEREAS